MAALVEGKAVRITGGNIRNKRIPVGPIPDPLSGDRGGGVGTFETDIAGDKKLLGIRADHAIGASCKRNGAADGSVIFCEK
jgi:hypothetical protein